MFFLKLYRAYNFYFSPTKLIFRSTVRNFFSTIPSCSRIIEIGGGNAMMRPVLKKACRANEYISTDIEPTDQTDIICDAQDMIFSDEDADVIAAFEVMEHIPDTNKFLSEVSRVLRPNGYLVISVPFLYGRHDYQDFYRWTEQGLKKVLSDNAFDIVVLKPRGGTFLSMVTLVSNYMHSLFSHLHKGWRANKLFKKAYFSFMTIVMFPIMLLSWLAFFLDLVIDRNSSNPSGYVLIAQKTENTQN